MTRPVFTPYSFNSYGGYNPNPYSMNPYGMNPYSMNPQGNPVTGMNNNYPVTPQEPSMEPQNPQTVQAPQGGTTIQNIQNTQVLNPQAICYFVDAKDDMQSLKVEPNTFYIGINRQAKEMYVRSWNNDGNIDFNTYTLTEGKQETSGIASIIEKLDSIESKLNTINIQSVKERDNGDNGQYATESDTKRNGWSNAKRSENGSF